MSNIKLSIVSPVYRAEKMVHMLVERIVKSVSTITEDFEIILVNDASPDASWSVIEHECAQDKRVKGINLSRNFGQHYAITAGLHYAKGEWVVVMDCDLQDRPEEITALYQKAMEGYDIVYARRVDRQDKWFKRTTSKIFNTLLNKMSGLNKDKDVANYGIYHNRVISEYNKIPEQSRSFGSLILYLGFRTTIINVQHAERAEGSSFLPSEVIAAFLWGQLEHLDDIQARRKHLWNLYYTNLSPISSLTGKSEGVSLPSLGEQEGANAYMFYLVCNNLEQRSALIKHLKDNGVLAVFHYLSLHSSPYYQDKHDGHVLPECDRYADCLVRLPMYYDLKDEEVVEICKLIKKFVTE